MHQDAFDRVDEYLQREIRDLCIPGMAVAVTDRRKLLWVATYGFSDIAARHPVTPIHRFQIGSISKSFASISLLQMQDEGKVDIDDPVTKHLPWFKVRTRFGPITLRHLMSHTAGISMGADSSPSAYAEVLALSEQQTSSAPGTHFHYSNTGYKVIGLVLEELAGKPNGEVQMERVIGPLGMDSTEAEITNRNRDAQPVGYSFQNNDRPQPSCPRLAPATWFESYTADGSIISTPEDMAKYVRMLLNRGAGDDGRVLSRRGFELLTSKVIRPGDGLPSEYYGLGLGIRTDHGHMIVSHTGGMVGFVSEIAADMDSGLGVVILNNSRVDSAGVARNVLRIAGAVKDGKKAPRIKRFDPTLVAGGGTYAGAYMCGKKRVRIESDGKHMMLRTGADMVTLEVRGKDRFYAPHPDFELFEVRFGRGGRKVTELFYGPDSYMKQPCSCASEPSHPKEWDAFKGRYLAHNPWSPSFRIVLRKGALVFVDPSGGQEPLTPLEDGGFRVGADPLCPERIRFDRVVRGKATRAVLSGGEWFRASPA